MKSNEEWSSQFLTQFMQLHKKRENNSGLFQACINFIHNCEDHSSFDFISAFIIWLFHIYHSHNNEGSLIHRGDANFLHTMLWKMQWYTVTPDPLSILFPGIIDLFCIPTWPWVDKILRLMWNCPLELQPHFFMFAHQRGNRKRSISRLSLPCKWLGQVSIS